jgi:plastocyanin
MLRTLLLSACALALTPAAAAAGEVEVTQRDKTFLPGQVSLKVGDTLVFKNEDPITHNMFSRSEPNDFNLKLQKPGEDMRQTFRAPGEVLVRCAIHPKMKLLVTVEE